MNSFKPVKADDIAYSMGLPPDDNELPSRAGTADAIRNFIRVHRVAKRDEVEMWFLTLASTAGYPNGPSQMRFRSVCSQLVAAGDCALAEKEGAAYLISVEPRTVDLGLEHDAILGDAPDGIKATPGNDVVRRIQRQESSMSLSDHLRCPPWSSLAESLALARETSPSQFLTTIRHSRGAHERLPQYGCEAAFEISLSAKGVRLCLVKDGNDQIPLISFKSEQGEEHGIRLDSEEQLAWLYLSDLGIDATGNWPKDLPLPSNVLAALSLLGEALDDDLTRWTLSEEARITLSEWLGIPLKQGQAQTGDPAQSNIIEAPQSARLLVAAGPGSGKTWTACKRVSKLIEGGASPSRILMISFTRAAVAEIRSRIASYLANPRDAFELNIQTLDSLAWSLNVGAGDKNRSLGGFDRSIAAALQLLENPEDWLLDEVERYQHVLIDEAQDLAGNRKSLILALLQHIPEECGSTVFHDPAQAIYGFLEAGVQGIEMELASCDPPFQKVALDRNYRCKSQKLEAMFNTGRSLLLAPDPDAKEVYDRIRQGIEETASPFRPAQAANDGRSTFYLYRWRGQLNTSIDRALNAGIPFRTRLPQHRHLVQPWIAATLHNFHGRAISESEFADLYDELQPHPGGSSDEAWQTLRRICGTAGRDTDLVRLAEIMIGSSAWPEIAISDIGPRSAPLYSTIHAAKGREAEAVVLSLPNEPNGKSSDEIIEEARVLYVGATRASTELRVAAAPRGMRTLKAPSRRTWRGWLNYGTPAARVEVGRPDDINSSMQVADRRERDDANYALWRSSGSAGSVTLTFADGCYRISMTESGIGIGSLSATFNNDLRAIAKELTEDPVHPARKIEGAFMLGATSMATLDDGGTPLFELAPILAGTPLVFFNRN